MEKEKIIAWVERLNAEPDGKKRNTIVAEMCKEHSLKIGDAWKLLKESGFAPKGASQDIPDTQQDNPEAPQAEPVKQKQDEKKQEEQKQPVLLRHKTEYQWYRCAGLALTQKPETYQVTASQLEKLKKDPWVEFPESKDDKEDNEE
jgi:hypothetical protein